MLKSKFRCYDYEIKHNWFKLGVLYFNLKTITMYVLSRCAPLANTTVISNIFECPFLQQYKLAVFSSEFMYSAISEKMRSPARDIYAKGCNCPEPTFISFWDVLWVSCLFASWRKRNYSSFVNFMLELQESCDRKRNLIRNFVY